MMEDLAPLLDTLKGILPLSYNGFQVAVLKKLLDNIKEFGTGAIHNTVLIHAVATGFGLGMGLGLYKIIANVQYIKIVVPLLILVIILLFLTPEPYGSIAMDSASATTGPVNIPLNMALAVGLASIIETADPLLSGFGIVVLTSIGAMVSVFTLPIYELIGLDHREDLERLE